MEFKHRMQMMFTFVFLAAFCCLTTVCQEDDFADDGGDESVQYENPPTSAEQYVNFLATGGQSTDGPLPEEDEGINGPINDEDDGGSETIDLLMKHYRDQFNDLSVEKVKAKLMEDIKDMDLDKDGHISKQELTIWLIQMAEIGSVKEARVLEGVKSYDLNKDNKISWEEILTDLKKLGNPENPIFKRGLDMEKVRFEDADSDKDGFLDSHEYSFYATPEYFTRMDNYSIRSYIHDFDMDDDLKISKEEYLKAYDLKRDPEGRDIENKKFDSMDKNKDGYLTGDEVAHIALQFTLTKFADNHVDMLFMNVDADKDGKLSSVEIISNYPLFTKGMPEEEEPQYKHDEL